jgi:hypothetical protein
MEPGQHLRDGGLRHQAKAHPGHADGPEAVLEAVDRPLVLVGGQSRELLAVGIHHRDCHKDQREQGNRDRLGLPHAHPRRIRLVHLGPSALQHGSGQPVLGFKDGKAAMPGGTVHAVTQEGQLPGVGRRERLGADHEDGRLGVARRTCSLQTVEVVGIQIAEGERIRALLDLHAVVDTAAHKARALEGLGPSRADDEERAFLRLEARAQVVEAVVAQQAATHIGVVEIAKPQFDERFGVALQPHLFGLDEQSLHRAHFDELRPVVTLAIGRKTRGITHRGRDDAGLACHGGARKHHHLVLRDHGHGGAGDGVHTDHFFLGARGTDLQLVGDGLAQVLVVEIHQRRLRDAEQQNGLGMLEHLDAHEAPLGVHPDQCDHRLARVGRRVGDVGREHHIAQQLLLGRIIVIGLHIRWLPLALRKMPCARKHLGAGQQCTHVGRRVGTRR